ncbi:MAG: hypothetical protein QOG23_2404 [Blastocatellia bacterium]|jgi:tetratricopeptide (TPR) repeat protein|nr:hypothetical protein [Blastocatellia bacterium]
MTEDNVQVAAQKGWKNFEAFAREILRRFFLRSQLEIKDTPWSHDGGRDGEAVYIFAPARADGVADDLEIVVRLWVEVKLRKDTAVNLHDAGSHLVRAENQKVNKLVFVTNGTFAPETREQLDIYCMNRHLSCAFVDGGRLEELRLKDLEQAKLPTEPQEPESLVASLELLVRLSNDPSPRDFHPRGQVCSKPEAPVFLILDVRIKGDHSTLALPSITPPAEVEHCLLYQSSLSLPLIDGERFRAVYAVWGRPGATFRPADFVIAFGGIPDEAISRRLDTGQVTIGTRFLSPYALASHERVAAPVRRALERWSVVPGHAVYAIEASAGVGKSYVVQELRRQWLGDRVREIWLDGGFHNIAWDIVAALAGALFPLASLSSSDQGEEVLEHWLKDAGVADSSLAQAVARNLTTASSTAPLNWSACVGILSTLLRHGSAQNPIVIVYEDMHKASPSAVLLMRAMLGRIGYEGAGNSFILLTTRPTEQVWQESQSAGHDSEAGPSTFGTPLDQLLADLSQEGRLLAMERPSANQARALLASSLPYAEGQLLDSMVDQVGTTPFALKELIAYLAAIGAIEPASTGAWHLVASRALSRRPELDDLRHATEDRVTLLLRKWEIPYPWLDDFLLTGALLGRDFAAAQASAASEAPINKLPSAIVDLLFSADVAQPGPFNVGTEQLRFTHDLIRVAFLKRRSYPVSMRLASRLLQLAPAEMPTLLRCRLARNAGDVEACRLMAEVGYAKAREGAQYWEALQFRLLALWAVDAARASKLLDASRLVRFITIDPALEIGPIGTSVTPSRSQVIAIIFDCLETVVNIGFGGGKVVDALMNEAAMLVRFAGAEEQKARLDYYAGRFAFDVDDFRRSLEYHAAVEEVYSGLNEPALLSKRQDNLNRLFLCQRQLDLTAGAEKTLDLLGRLDTGKSPEYSARMQAYRGYLHLYHDLSLVPAFWQRAAEIARAAGNQQRFAHHAIGRAYALLLLNEVPEAVEAFNEIEKVLMSGPKLQGMRLRLDLDAGVLALVRQDFNEAEARLSDALNQGLQLDVFRRLWRIEANLATLYEVQGNLERCAFYDRRAIRGVLVRAKAEQSLGGNAPWLHQRHVLPVLNLLLRKRAGVPTPRVLLHSFSVAQQTEINRLADLVQEGRLMELPNSLAWHCKSIAGRDRFIPTE